MSIHEKVFARLSPLGVPLYRSMAPQTQQLPYIVFSAISQVEEIALESSTGLENTRMQVDCYADDPTEAYDLYKSARDLLQVSGTDFGCGQIQTTGELPELAVEGHRYTGDFSLWHDIG